MRETFAKHLQCARGHARGLDTKVFIHSQILPSACRLCAGHLGHGRYQTDDMSVLMGWLSARPGEATDTSQQ